MGGTVAGLVAVSLGCASSAPTVRDADLGRLPGERLGLVQQAQAAYTQAQQERDEAIRRRDETKTQLSVIEPGMKTASTDIKGSQTALDAAKASGDLGQIRVAERQLEIAKLFRQEQLAKRDFLRRESEAREGEVTLAGKRVKLARAQLEEAKALALRDSNDPAARHYDLARFHDAVANRWDAFAAERSRVQGERDGAQTAFERWQGLRSQFAKEQGLVPARGGEGYQSGQAPSLP
ncbi:MAG: hypothetical protein ACYCWW_17545 [Deltaproteobacteria bacterium]